MDTQGIQIDCHIAITGQHATDLSPINTNDSVPLVAIVTAQNMERCPLHQGPVGIGLSPIYGARERTPVQTSVPDLSPM